MVILSSVLDMSSTWWWLLRRRSVRTSLRRISSIRYPTPSTRDGGGLWQHPGCQDCHLQRQGWWAHWSCKVGFHQRRESRSLPGQREDERSEKEAKKKEAIPCPSGARKSSPWGQRKVEMMRCFEMLNFHWMFKNWINNQFCSLSLKLRPNLS